MAGILFDITFTPGASAVGGILEYRAVQAHQSGPAAQLPYPWVVNTNNPIGNAGGYFNITTSPMILNDVPGVLPDFQENTAYEFRIKQLCPDGSEPYSDVDGTYWVPACVIPAITIEAIPAQQGPYGIGVTWYYTAGSSIYDYTLNLYDSNNIIIGTQIVNSYVLDQSGNTPYTFIFTNANTSTSLIAGATYRVEMIVRIETENPPTPSNLVTVTNCPPFVTKAPNCESYEIQFGDQWGIEWFDCNGELHNCYSDQPYKEGGSSGLVAPLRLCALGVPRTYYCDGSSFVDGYLDDGAGNVTQGGLVSFVASGCQPGYDDYSTGLLYPNGAPVSCIVNPTCGVNKIVAGICVAPEDFSGTTFRNGDPIPYVDDPIVWASLTTPAWCWVGDQVGSPYGKLYNWYAVTDSRNIAPVGFHVPTKAEWSAWVQDIINDGKSPNDLRITGSLYWNNNSLATDFYGYGALGAGRRYINGSFLNLKNIKFYWVDSTADPLNSWAYTIATGTINPAGTYGFATPIKPVDVPSEARNGLSVRLFCD